MLRKIIEAIAGKINVEINIVEAGSKTIIRANPTPITIAAKQISDIKSKTRSPGEPT